MCLLDVFSLLFWFEVWIPHKFVICIELDAVKRAKFPAEKSYKVIRNVYFQFVWRSHFRNRFANLLTGFGKAWKENEEKKKHFNCMSSRLSNKLNVGLSVCVPTISFLNEKVCCETFHGFSFINKIFSGLGKAAWKPAINLFVMKYIFFFLLFFSCPKRKFQRASNSN